MIEKYIYRAIKSDIGLGLINLSRGMHSTECQSSLIFIHHTGLLQNDCPQTRSQDCFALVTHWVNSDIGFTAFLPSTTFQMFLLELSLCLVMHVFSFMLNSGLSYKRELDLIEMI